MDAADRASLAAAITDASGALDRGEDPRETIVRLYVKLVGALEGRVGDVSRSTAEEIRRAHLLRLGVSEANSQTLTRLFETARYSTHPIDPPTASHFGTVLRSAERNVLHGTGVA